MSLKNQTTTTSFQFKFTDGWEIWSLSEATRNSSKEIIPYGELLHLPLLLVATIKTPLDSLVSSSSGQIQTTHWWGHQKGIQEQLDVKRLLDIHMGISFMIFPTSWKMELMYLLRVVQKPAMKATDRAHQ